MQLKKFRWSKVYESSEEELIDFLNVRSITPSRFHIAEMEVEQHVADAARTLWCAEGSFTLDALDRQYSMQPGDAISLPAATDYTITAGISGCVYFLSN